MYHICIVEDEPNIIEALRYLMEAKGWQVEVVSDGGLAVEAVRHQLPDLLILDYMLPNMSGLAVAKELRTHPDTADLPILMLSAKGQTKDKQQAQIAGINLFMTKPFANSDLIEQVSGLLGARST